MTLAKDYPVSLVCQALDLARSRDVMLQGSTTNSSTETLVCLHYNRGSGSYFTGKI